MTGIELRNALALEQATCAILSDHARELGETQIEALIRDAEEKLRKAWDKLESYVALSGGEQTAFFGRPGEATPFGV